MRIQTRTLISFLTCSACFELAAQEPPIAGSWSFHQLAVSYSVIDFAENEIEFEETRSTEIPLTIGADQTIQAETDTLRWLFSDDWLVIVESGRTLNAAVNVTGDTFALSEGTLRTEPDQETSFAVAVKAPTTPHTNAVFSDTEWVLLRQSIDSRENPPAPGSMVSEWDETKIERVDATFSADLTFEATVISDSTNPERAGIVTTGDWAVIGGTLEIGGSDPVSFAHISAGGDFLVDSTDDSEADGASTRFERAIEVWVKRPTTLVASDILGDWGIVGFTVELTRDQGIFAQGLEGVNFQHSRLTFRSDGTATSTVKLTNDGRDPGEIENLTWTLDGRDILVANASETFRLFISAEKDSLIFANAVTSIPDESEVTWLIVASKLPDAPGFAAVRVGAQQTMGSQVQLTLDESLTGVLYDVQESRNLRDWTSLDLAIPGSGLGLATTLETADSQPSFYRWAVTELE